MAEPQHDAGSRAQPTSAESAPSEGFSRAARVVGGLTLASRASGLARDAVCARVFGAGPVWSAFAFAFLLPNLFRRLFGEGALSAAFLPEYARLLRADRASAGRALNAAIAGMVILLGAIVLIGEAAIFLLRTGTPLGESGGLALSLAMIMLPYTLLVCGVALLGAALQCHDRFAPTAAAPIILNLAIIAAAVASTWWLGLEAAGAIFAVAVSVVAAGLIQVAVSLAALRGRHAWRAGMQGAAPALRRVGKQMGPAAIGLGALQINSLLDGLIASWPVIVGATLPLPGLLGGPIDYPMDEASNAVLFFAQRLYQFPLGVFGIALATAVFPVLARSAAEPARFDASLRAALRLGFFIGAPATVGLALVREPLIGLLYEGGEFGAAAAERVAWTLLGYAPAIWAATLAHLLTRALYARGEAASSMRIALTCIAVNLALSLTLIWTLREAALAWATSISAAVQVALLLGSVRRRLEARWLTHETVRSSAQSVALTAVMGVCVALVGRALGDDPAASARAVRLTVMVGAGALIYLGGAAAIRMPEARWLVRRDAGL